MISSFHSPMEKECLRILLQGTQPVIISPARGIWRRIPKEWKRHISSGRLLIVSKFPDKITKMTEHRAVVRNQFIGDLADLIFVAFAEPDGKMEKLCRGWVSMGIKVMTFDSKYNRNLFELGAAALDQGGNKDD